MVPGDRASPLNEVHRHGGKPGTRLCPRYATNSFQNLRKKGNKHLVKVLKPGREQLILSQQTCTSGTCMPCARVTPEPQNQQGPRKHVAPPRPLSISSLAGAPVSRESCHSETWPEEGNYQQRVDKDPPFVSPVALGSARRQPVADAGQPAGTPQSPYLQAELSGSSSSCLSLRSAH